MSNGHPIPLCIQIMIMGHTNYESSDYQPNLAKKMAAIRPSWIRSISSLAHWYIQWLSTSFLFSVYINYGHGSHKLWKFWFSAIFSKQNGRQSAILHPICLKFCTLIHSMIVYKFSIHYVYKLWSRVTKIMKVLIFSQIQQRIMDTVDQMVVKCENRNPWNFAHE